MKSTFKSMLRLMSAICLLPALAACGAKNAESGIIAPEVAVDLGQSELYTQKERSDAMHAVRSKFASFAGCVLHSVRYAGDEANNEENLRWLNSLVDGAEFTQVAEFLTDFHSPVEDGPYAWERDSEYKDYQWWLARKKDGDWALVSWGY
jgi:D-alanyl-D-alanine carboxypeptidase